MISFQYLQITSTLVAQAHAPGLAARIASSHVASVTRLEPGEEGESLHFLADMHLLRGEPEEAEDDYRRALKAGAQLPHVNAWSCRAAGLQALFRHRLETAAACMEKLIEDTQAPLVLRLEARALAALLLHEAGARAMSRQYVLDIARDATTPALAGWRHLAGLLAEDFEVRATVQEAPDLSDDVHWRAIEDDGRVQLQATPLLVSGAAGEGEALIAQRHAQLGLLRALVQGDARDSMAVQPVLRGLGTQLGAACREVVILELAQAALAARNVSLGEILTSQLKLPTLPTRGLLTPVQRQQLYCLSRLRMLQGRFDDGFSLYRAYAAAAMQIAREHHTMTRRFVPAQATQAAPNDDISARLPARYRRAYQFMLAHLHRNDLSIAEVAGAIGVTERALQLAFKEYVDVSPREVLRRLRMQKIREELQQGDSEVQLMEVAMRFGVQNRTSLVAGYRKYFEETPSATLTRRG